MWWNEPNNFTSNYYCSVEWLHILRFFCLRDNYKFTYVNKASMNSLVMRCSFNYLIFFPPFFQRFPFSLPFPIFSGWNIFIFENASFVEFLNLLIIKQKMKVHIVNFIILCKLFFFFLIYKIFSRLSSSY